MATALMTAMISKLSDYDLFVNLFVGALWMVITGMFFALDLLSIPVAYAIVLSYFVGLTIGRIGSLIVEWLLKCFRKSSANYDYKKFILAEFKDQKIATLQKVSIIYRNLTALMLVLLVTRWILSDNGFITVCNCIFHVVVICLLILFFLSYCKQDNYVKKRIGISAEQNT